MSDEATFQRLLSEQPDDAASWLVYADWLEANGESQRATVVRLHRELIGHTEHVPRLATARRILDEAKGLPRDWLARFPVRRSLENECWGARAHDEAVYLVRFLASGKLLFKQGEAGDSSDPPDEINGDGNWMQIGDAITFSIALHDNRKKDFSRHDGVIAPKKERLEGIGSNADGQIWTWGLAPLTLAEFDNEELPDLPAKPHDSKQRSTDKAKHLLPKRRWK